MLMKLSVVWKTLLMVATSPDAHARALGTGVFGWSARSSTHGSALALAVTIFTITSVSPSPLGHHRLFVLVWRVFGFLLLSRTCTVAICGFILNFAYGRSDYWRLGIGQRWSENPRDLLKGAMTSDEHPWAAMILQNPLINKHSC